MPKPRNRPSVPPPPHPPSQLAGDGIIANPTQTASKIVTGEWIPSYSVSPQGPGMKKMSVAVIFFLKS